MSKPIVDFHCDVLCKLLVQPELTFLHNEGGKLDVSYERLKQAGTALQTFAIYIPEHLNGSIVPILESIDLFNEKVMTCPDMHFIKTKSDLQQCLSAGAIGAMLSLEGVDGLQGNLSLLRVLFELGVRAAGLTWNHANWAADGVMEPRGGGLTAKGRELVKECDRLGIIVDVSHLSERAFWDTADLATRTIIASHSNSKSIMNHPRNLTDDQIKAIIALQGRVGITFVPYFVAGGEKVAIDDVLRHVEHVCELGGEHHLMFGSDFDGIDHYVDGLTHPGQVEDLREALLKRYTEQQTEAFFAGNALSFLAEHLPD
ncbi:dipeptidase [Paenibacillus radicis (ex Gao et al. 2016)]|uniref:Diguanylate cyclase n=1 Tax=Paenibacillus radicis (ex Gao et al. 2016) TaxID=1737354 RepID=A0A917HJ67_9BACL|nr:dipeptidase [Paenibacillus radicis (ex Gao et al. 2016)]GGG80260.1 diguanylate cyclase [Paenibacillus radicis (ex Gao et al. 2016)]